MSNRGHARSDSAGLTGSFCLLSGPSPDALCSSRSHGPGDNAAVHLDLKIRERKARMSGYDSPQQYDMTLVAELRRPSSWMRSSWRSTAWWLRVRSRRRASSGSASRETTCRSLELSMCRRMPSPTSQVIDASSPLGDIVADLIRNIRLVSVGLWPYRHPCHRIKA